MSVGTQYFLPVSCLSKIFSYISDCLVLWSKLCSLFWYKTYASCNATPLGMRDMHIKAWYIIFDILHIYFCYKKYGLSSKLPVFENPLHHSKHNKKEKLKQVVKLKDALWDTLPLRGHWQNCRPTLLIYWSQAVAGTFTRFSWMGSFKGSYWSLNTSRFNIHILPIGLYVFTVWTVAVYMLADEGICRS